MEIIWYLFSHFLWFNSVPENSSWIKWNSMFPHNNNDSKRVSRQVIHWVWNNTRFDGYSKAESHFPLSYFYYPIAIYFYLYFHKNLFFMHFTHIFTFLWCHYCFPFVLLGIRQKRCQELMDFSGFSFIPIFSKASSRYLRLPKLSRRFRDYLLIKFIILKCLSLKEWKTLIKNRHIFHIVKPQ